MKMLRTLAIIAGVMAVAAFSPAVKAQPLMVAANGLKTFTISDKVGNNKCVWVSTAPLDTVQGSADSVTGVLTFNPKDPQTLKGTFAVMVTSITSGNDTVDRQLRSKAWLNSAKYPSITFKITSVSDLKVNGSLLAGNVTGTVAAHGVTRHVTGTVKLHYLDANPTTALRAPGDLIMLNVQFILNPVDFNVQGKKGFIGSKVSSAIGIAAQLYCASGL